MNMLSMFMGGNNGINPMQMMNMVQQAQNNPQQIMQQMGNNPLMQRANQMAQGKSPQEMEQICRNIAQQKGIDFEQLKGMAQQMGIKL